MNAERDQWRDFKFRLMAVRGGLSGHEIRFLVAPDPHMEGNHAMLIW